MLREEFPTSAAPEVRKAQKLPSRAEPDWYWIFQAYIHSNCNRLYVSGSFNLSVVFFGLMIRSFCLYILTKRNKSPSRFSKSPLWCLQVACLCNQQSIIQMLSLYNNIKQKKTASPHIKELKLFSLLTFLLSKHLIKYQNRKLTKFLLMDCLVHGLIFLSGAWICQVNIIVEENPR